MATTPILILGGRGKTGRHVTDQLQARGLDTRLASRSSTPAFDWYDDSTWAAATAGIDTAYLAPPVDPTGLGRAGRFVEQAAAGGLRRLVLLSGRGVGSPGREFAVYQCQLELENAVKDSGVEWTILRPAWFMQNFSESFFHDQVIDGELRASTGDGAEPWIDTEDIAEVAVTALTEAGHEGQSYSLSGPRTLTLDEVASELAAATGRELRHVDLAPEAHVAELTGFGVPPEEAEALRDLLAVIRLHRSEYLSDGVQEVLGRPPRDFTDWARRTAESGGLAR